MSHARALLAVPLEIVSDLVAWIAILFFGMTCYYVVAEALGPVDGVGLSLFRVVFYSILVVAPVLALAATWIVASKLGVARLRADVAALVLAGAVALALIVVVYRDRLFLEAVSAMNQCGLGTSFPIDVSGCEG
jgi:hypothetical protein